MLSIYFIPFVLNCYEVDNKLNGLSAPPTYLIFCADYSIALFAVCFTLILILLLPSLLSCSLPFSERLTPPIPIFRIAAMPCHKYSVQILN